MKPKQIWANLAVKDVEATRKFYTELGFTSNEGHNKTNDITSFKVGDNGFVVHFFSHEHFKKSAENGISSNLSGGNEIMFSLWADSPAEADSWAAEVRQAGGTILTPPAKFGPGYYGFEFADPDGHKWNVFNM
jgi:predicted lactoylglutathione lyase